MDVKGAHTYAAPIDVVVGMLGDPAAAAARYEGMGHRNVAILECAREGGLLRVRSSRVVDIELPGFARRVLKPTNTVEQSDEWRQGADGTWSGTFAVDIHGSPVQMAGTMRLSPGDGVCTHEVTITVTVKVPLVGGRIAEWAGNNDVRRTLDAEFAFGDRWLADHSG
jgi:hypothetical protein